jgi:hypothetical protein
MVKLVSTDNIGKYDIRSINFRNRGIDDDRCGRLLLPVGNLSHTSILYTCNIGS